MEHVSPDFTPRREQRKTTMIAQQILNEMDEENAKYFSKVSAVSRTGSTTNSKHSRSLAK